MSYDLYLVDPVTKETLNLEEPHHMFGGTYQPGGTTEMWINITYNYASIFRKDHVLGPRGIERIENLSGAESMPMLENAIRNLGNDVNPNYWEPTEGNAKRALGHLLALARLRPDGIWQIH